MTEDELIAEITSGGFSKYEESGLIDYISLRRWIKSELKRFGNNLMVRSEGIVHIENYRAKLPFNFWQLQLAVKCDKMGYTKEDTDDVLQNSLFYKERIEGVQEWDNMSDSYTAKDFKYVREDYVFKGAKATFHYGNPQFLKLAKGFKRELCTSDCTNLRKGLGLENPKEINIIGDYINANFKEGVVYFMYRGLPTDGDGKLIIPKTQHDRLQEYLLYYCRARILEEVYAGGDGDVERQLSYYERKAQVNFMLAMTEVKMEALGKDWTRKLRNKQRAQTLKYDSMLPKL